MIISVRMVSHIGHSCASVTKGRLESRIIYHVVHLGLNVSSSSHTVIVGAWSRQAGRQTQATQRHAKAGRQSIAVALWQQFQYYYYY